MSSVILTTTDTVPGYRIESVLDVIEDVAAESPDAVSDLVSSLLNFTGGRNVAFDKPVLGAFQDVRAKLRQKAQAIGADAVVSIDFEVTEFTASGCILVVGVGTAVRLSPIEAS